MSSWEFQIEVDVVSRQDFANFETASEVEASHSMAFPVASFVVVSVFDDEIS